MARKAQETLAKSQGAMASGAMELQSRVVQFAEWLQSQSAKQEIIARLARRK